MAGIDDLIAGQIFDALTAPFTGGLFTADLFYLTLMLMGVGFVYMRNRSWGLVALVMVLTSNVFVPEIIPGLNKYFTRFIIVVVGLLLYTTFFGRD